MQDAPDAKELSTQKHSNHGNHAARSLARRGAQTQKDAEKCPAQQSVRFPAFVTLQVLAAFVAFVTSSRHSFMCMQQLAGSVCMQQPSAGYTCKGWFITARPCTCEEVAPGRGPAAIGGVLGMEGGFAAAARVLGLGEAPSGGLCLLVAWTNCLPTHQPLGYVADKRSLQCFPA